MRKYPRRHARGPFARATKRNGSAKHSVKFSALFYFLCKVTILTFENLETRNYHTPPEPAPHPNLIPRSSAVLRPGMPPQKLRTRQTRTYTYKNTRFRPPDPSARGGAHAAGPCCIGSDCTHASHETRAKPLHACTHGIGTPAPAQPGFVPVQGTRGAWARECRRFSSGPAGLQLPERTHEHPQPPGMRRTCVAEEALACVVFGRVAKRGLERKPFHAQQPRAPAVCVRAHAAR